MDTKFVDKVILNGIRAFLVALAIFSLLYLSRPQNSGVIITFPEHLSTLAENAEAVEELPDLRSAVLDAHEVYIGDPNNEVTRHLECDTVNVSSGLITCNVTLVTAVEGITLFKSFFLNEGVTLIDDKIFYRYGDKFVFDDSYAVLQGEKLTLGRELIFNVLARFFLLWMLIWLLLVVVVILKRISNERSST